MIRPRMEAQVPASGMSAEARDFCAQLTKRHYENFPVGSRWIPAAIRPDIQAVYAFARTADDFADEPEHEGSRLERLGEWRRLLHEAAEGKATHPVFIALSETIRRKNVPVEWLEDLIRAFETDVRQNRHATFDSILRYAELSANPVGRLVLWLHGCRGSEEFALSDRICSALQFANFWQDVAVDWVKNRVYLPQDDMARFAYTEDDLGRGVVDDRFRRLMAFEIERTRAMFRQGRALCDRVGPDLRMELRLVWSGGMRILDRIERNGYDVFRRRPSLRWLDQGAMLFRALTWRRSQ
ncbi:MAG: squalene synthase HpnC [Pseudomonadota bacterium]